MGIYLTAEQMKSFRLYFDLLREENKHLNLTTVIKAKEVAIKHFLDSLSCLRAVPFEGRMKVLDVGTGAGFPGIPLKICRPELMVTLLESIEKKAGFLGKVIRELHLAGVEVIRARAEDFGGGKGHREEFDRVVARAVARLSVLAEYCLPAVKERGFFVAMKGAAPEGEIEEAGKAIMELGGVVKEVFHLNLPFTGEDRNLVLIEKVRPTPLRYPRRTGIPLKRPL
ncbi:MAG: 16S rRNA (guanine(527)-N(7))-methyltransferase RsmG [Peptococcaceae bacterium]|nr:MAG: 16S rRNA (guanine(527)-N(7))-methyltransferase RsmG [Peptococcaceae bacterium]